MMKLKIKPFTPYFKHFSFLHISHYNFVKHIGMLSIYQVNLTYQIVLSILCHRTLMHQGYQQLIDIFFLNVLFFE